MKHISNLVLVGLLATASQTRAFGQDQKPPDKQLAFHVTSVIVGWPANLAGIEPGHLILEINHDTIQGNDDLRKAIKQAIETRSEIVFTVMNVRDGEVVVRRVSPKPRDGKIGLDGKVVKRPAPLVPDQVAGNLKNLLKRRGLAPAAFQIGVFDSTKLDPVVLFWAWEAVQTDIELTLKYQLGLKEQPSLPLLLEEAPGGPNYRRIGVPGQTEKVTKVLKNALDLKDEHFFAVDAKLVKRAVLVPVSAFLAKFRLKNGDLNLEAVEIALSKFKRPGDLAGLTVKAYSKPGEYAYVKSGWIEAVETKNADGRFFYRLQQGVDRHPTSKNVWDIFVLFEIVWVPLSAQDPQKYIKNLKTSERHPDVAKRIQIQMSSKGEDKLLQMDSTAWTVQAKDKRGEKVQVPDYETKSNLFLAAVSLLSETQVMLCGKEKDERTPTP